MKPAALIGRPPSGKPTGREPLSPPSPGNTYAAVFNGTTIGNGLNNTRIRSPAVSGTATFAGDSLTLNANTELRAKGNLPTTLNFPGVNGNPGLILNGGMLNDGDSTCSRIGGYHHGQH